STTPPPLPPDHAPDHPPDHQRATPRDRPCARHEVWRATSRPRRPDTAERQVPWPAEQALKPNHTSPPPQRARSGRGRPVVDRSARVTERPGVATTVASENLGRDRQSHLGRPPPSEIQPDGPVDAVQGGRFDAGGGQTLQPTGLGGARTHGPHIRDTPG